MREVRAPELHGSSRSSTPRQANQPPVPERFGVTYHSSRITIGAKMSEFTETQQPIEPERYELTEPPAYRFRPGRREFFQWLGGGLLVLFILEGTEGVG